MYSKDAFVALSSLSTAFSGCGTQHDAQGLLPSFGGWKNDTYNQLIAEAYATADKAVRSEKLHQAEAILANEAPIIPIVFNQNFAFVSKDVSGVTYDGYGNAIFTKANQRNYEDYLN